MMLFANKTTMTILLIGGVPVGIRLRSKGVDSHPHDTTILCTDTDGLPDFGKGLRPVRLIPDALRAKGAIFDRDTYRAKTITKGALDFWTCAAVRTAEADFGPDDVANAYAATKDWPDRTADSMYKTLRPTVARVNGFYLVVPEVEFAHLLPGDGRAPVQAARDHVDKLRNKTTHTVISRKQLLDAIDAGRIPDFRVLDDPLVSRVIECIAKDGLTLAETAERLGKSLEVVETAFLRWGKVFGQIQDGALRSAIVFALLSGGISREVGGAASSMPSRVANVGSMGTSTALLVIVTAICLAGVSAATYDFCVPSAKDTAAQVPLGESSVTIPDGLFGDSSVTNPEIPSSDSSVTIAEVPFTDGKTVETDAFGSLSETGEEVVGSRRRTDETVVTGPNSPPQDDDESDDADWTLPEFCTGATSGGDRLAAGARFQPADIRCQKQDQDPRQLRRVIAVTRVLSYPRADPDRPMFGCISYPAELPCPPNTVCRPTFTSQRVHGRRMKAICARPGTFVARAPGGAVARIEATMRNPDDWGPGGVDLAGDIARRCSGPCQLGYVGCGRLRESTEEVDPPDRNRWACVPIERELHSGQVECRATPVAIPCSPHHRCRPVDSQDPDSYGTCVHFSNLDDTP